ncbi:two-component response regulator [Oceanicaulis sp. HTCC2633]|uniref:winged helix-turn-helix domain-containing protein n=1 Tax=Oceanicaulis sp. HTCC2633 TaxID=314254 RepID=UPI00006699E1|nr:helix-turn-helix domain-containing protein [Oceanicaulis sp. HTCC2633]EAP89150.1 two-component response regulator [Oceanicaulis sp. HTCC2633]
MCDDPLCAARIEALEVENTALREQLARLRAEWMNPEWRAPVELGLTPNEEAILAALKARGALTKDQIHFELYGDRIDGGPEMKIVDVLVCKLRKKLKPFEIAIDTEWGRGYALTAQSKDRLNAMEAAHV